MSNLNKIAGAHIQMVVIICTNFQIILCRSFNVNMRTEFCLQIDGHTNRVTPIYPLKFVGGGIPTDQSNKTIKYM